MALATRTVRLLRVRPNANDPVSAQPSRAAAVMDTVSGCTSIEERQLRPGIFDIGAPASRFINSEGRTEIILRLRAPELCPKGFNRLSASRIVDANALETIIWRISCRGR